MQWVKTKERLPSEDGSYFVIGKMGRGSIPFKDGEWNKDNPHFQVFEEVEEWLDESKISFTIENMKDAHNEGMLDALDGELLMNQSRLFHKYMFETHSIDITK